MDDRDPLTAVDERRLRRAFASAFDADPAERRVVARQALDLAASGKPRADRGAPLTIGTVIDNLADAPADCSLAERWNWWLGSLEVAHGGYRRFQVQAVRDPERGEE